MRRNKLGQQQVTPTTTIVTHDNGLQKRVHHEPGLTKREWMAALAMQGLLSDGEGYVKFAADRDPASAAVGIADALIEALEVSS